MPISDSTASPHPIHWIDRTSRLEGIPGEFRRHGRYLYVNASRHDGLLADGHPVDGLQLIRTSPESPTRIVVRDLVLEGVERGGAVGVRVLRELDVAADDSTIAALTRT